MRFSINCSTVICSLTVILMLSWEKPLVKPMAPGSIYYHICFQSTFICIFTFCIYITKYQKYIYFIILSLLDLTFASGREGIDNPFIALVASSQFVCVGAWDFWGASYWIDTLVLKTEGNTYATLCCITLSSSGKTNASSRRSKKDFWRRCRGGLRSSQDIPSTHHKPISLAFTLFAICLSFSSPPLPPCRFIRHLFPNLLLSFRLPFSFAHVLVHLPCHYG